jgi:hypothetical protein
LSASIAVSPSRDSVFQGASSLRLGIGVEPRELVRRTIEPREEEPFRTGRRAITTFNFFLLAIESSANMGIYRRLVRATPWWMKTDFRHVRPLYWLCALEFPFTVASLALFGIADPDTYRTALWTEGSTFGWNSDPIEILYSFANYQPMQPPTPWNQLYVGE